MKKRIFVVAVCASVLCGCGSSTASGSADSAVSDAVEAAADIAYSRYHREDRRSQDQEVLRRIRAHEFDKHRSVPVHRLHQARRFQAAVSGAQDLS